MKLHLKVVAVACLFLVFTWVMPPETILSQFAAQAMPLAERDASSLNNNVSLNPGKSLEFDKALAERASSSDVNMMQNDNKLDSSNIVGEVVDRRDEFTKHFRMEDGTFQAVMYDTAVNYQKSDGTWAEVDNTLVQAKDKNGNAVFKTKDNGYMDVSFAGSLKGGDLVSVQKGKHKLSWKLTDAAKAISSETATPAPTIIPAPSATPEPIATPETTAIPEPTAVPTPVDTSVPTAEITTTDTTASLDTVSAPITTDKPAPEAAATSDIANTPETTATPIATATIDSTVTPNITLTPEALATLETTPAPETPSPTVSAYNDNQVLSVNAAVIDDVSGKKATLKGNDLKRFADKAKSHIKYAGVKQGVDIDYIVEAQRIKENITLSDYVPNYSISFDISASGLTLKTIEGGITAFCDGKTEVFYLMPSYMTDSADHDCSVKTSLEPIDGGYRLTLVPDNDWLKTATYPVMIDPQIDVDWAPGNINDTYVSSNWPNGINNDGTNGPWYSYASLRLGYQTPDYGTLYGLVKYTSLPVLKSSETVVGAYMMSEREDDYSGDYQFTMHKVTSSWSQTAVTWNTKPLYSSTVEETHMIGDTYGAYGAFYTWDITSMMRSWYNDQSTNYGLLIKGVSTSAGYRRLFAAEATYVDDAVKTVIQYVNTAGIESYWPYQSMDARRAGTASVNLFTGNLVVSHSDIGTSGNRMPVSISHVYNAVYKDTDIGYGMGWQVNYAQTIASETISGVLYYKYTDEDGTIHYFRQNGTTYDDESGQNRKLELNKSITDINNNTVTYSYTITDKSDNVWCFDSSGRLVKIKDAIGNYISIAYNTGNKISTVTDGAGRSYTFSYIGGTGELQTISAPGSRSIGYGYDGSNRLTTITYPDSQQTTYTYNTSGVPNNTISKLKNYDGYNLAVSYNYATYMNPKVSSILEWGDAAQTVPGESESFEYAPKQTKVTDQLGNVNCYQFNQYGNAVTIQDEDGRAVYSQYYDPMSNVPGTSIPYGQNKMSLSSRLQEPVMNLIQNNSFETDSNWSIYNGGGGNISLATDPKLFGSKSLQIYDTDYNGYNMYFQYVPIEKGQQYTISVWVKTSNVTNAAGLQIGYWDSNNIEHGISPSGINGTNDWTRIVFTFAIPIDAYTNTIVVELLNVYGAGTAWFDGVQLEKSEVANRYNLIQNGDLTYTTNGLPNFWTKSVGCSSSDVSATTSDTGRGLLDNNVFMIAGSLTADKSLSQTVMVSGSSGDTFSFGGWAKASSVPLETKYPIGSSGTSYGRNFGIKVELLNGITSAGSTTMSFNAFSNLWQYGSERVVATGTYDRAIITLLYENEANTAYFDGIQLYKEMFGQCYDYDANGNLVTAKDLSANTNTIAYNADNEPTSLQPPDCTGTDKYTATYLTGNQKHLVDTATTIEGVKSKYSYDTYGNTTQAETRNDLANPTSYIRATAEYTTNGNYLYKTYDPKGNYTQYNYDTNFGVNDSTTDPSGQTVSYTYDKTTTKLGRLTGVSSTVGSTTYSNSYGYTNDFLTSIAHNGFNYTIGYNAFGQTTDVNVAGQNLVTNTYITSNKSYLLDYMTYGNGGKVDYSYDSRYRVNAITYDNESTPRYTYAYAANGQLGMVTDNQNGLTTRLSYDLADRPMQTVEQYTGLTRTFQYSYDIDNCLTQFLELFNTTQYKTNLTYDRDNRITSVNYGNPTGSENVRYGYDTLGRLSSKTLDTGTNDFSISYSYAASGYSPTGATTDLIEYINYNSATFLYYNYDSNSRISHIYNGKHIFPYYDGLGQLIRIDDENDTRGGSAGSTWTYAYDAGGNITSKKLYAFCFGDYNLSDNTIIHDYKYTYDTTWKDKLINYNGVAVTYPSSGDIGNLQSANGWNYTWEAGRQLKQMSYGSTAIQFKYNDAGLRTQKINGSTITKYYWAGTSISHMTSGSDTLHFWYDAAGLPSMVTYNGTNYYYLLNVQGDIIGLMDMAGNSVVSYLYDSWGSQLSCTGSLASTLGVANPLRYRGYIYDNDTGLYYLQSRYYNPQWGRFINEDGVIAPVSGLFSANLFAYCKNNPVNRIDPTGKLSTDESGGGFVTNGPMIGGEGAAAATVEGAGGGGSSAAIETEVSIDATTTEATAESESKGFNTFRQAKEYLNKIKPLNPGKQWHHIVEQCQIIKSGFEKTIIQNTNNLIAVEESVHTRISSYYSSIHYFTEELRYRDWLTGRSFDEQMERGLEMLRKLGVIK